MTYREAQNADASVLSVQLRDPATTGTLEQFEIKGIGRGDRDLVTLSSQTLGNLAEEDLRAANG